MKKQQQVPTHETIIGPISFLSPNLIEEKVETPKPVNTSKMRPTEAMIYGIQQQNLDVMKETAGRLSKPISSIAEKKIIRALMDQDWPHPLADYLHGEGFISNNNIVKCMNEETNYIPVLWMLKDEKSISRTEKEVGYPIPGHLKNGVLDKTTENLVRCVIYFNPKLSNKILDLDFTRILKGARGGQFGNAHKGLDWIEKAKERKWEHLAELVNKIYDPSVAAAVWYDLSAEEQRQKWAESAEFLVSKSLYSQSTEDIGEIEDILRKAPNAAACWNAYWTCNRQMNPEDCHPILNTNRAMNLLSQHWNGDGDFINLCLRYNKAPWLREALEKSGPLTNVLYDRLKTDYWVHAFVGEHNDKNFKPFNAILDRLGMDWRDPDGRHLLTVFTQFGPRDKSFLNWLENLPNHTTLLSLPDNNGRTAIDVLKTSEKWLPFEQEITRITQRILSKQAEPAIREKKRKKSISELKM